MAYCTKKCVRCGRTAIRWSGHVLSKRNPRQKITAGWCSEKCRVTAGFWGHYLRWMGKEIE